MCVQYNIIIRFTYFRPELSPYSAIYNTIIRIIYIYYICVCSLNNIQHPSASLHIFLNKIESFQQRPFSLRLFRTHVIQHTRRNHAMFVSGEDLYIIMIYSKWFPKGFPSTVSKHFSSGWSGADKK